VWLSGTTSGEKASVDMSQSPQRELQAAGNFGDRRLLFGTNGWMSEKSQRARGENNEWTREDHLVNSRDSGRANVWATLFSFQTHARLPTACGDAVRTVASGSKF
jgi:hypothetical protein